MFMKKLVIIFCLSSFLLASQQLDAKKRKEDKPTVTKIEPLHSPEHTKKQSLNKKNHQSEAKRWPINRIVRRVNGANILQSDLDQPRLVKEGGTCSLEELTVEELLVQRASEMHMLPTPADIDRQILAFKMNNNLANKNDEEFEKALKEFGFTLPQYKLQLGRLIAADNVRRMEISERIVITSQEVENYHTKHPAKTKEKFWIKICTIPHEEMEDPTKFLNSNNASWNDLGWIEQSDIGEHFSSIFSLQPGQTSEPINVDGNYKAVKLVEKEEAREKTLDERYIKIERKLQEKKRAKFLDSFETELKEKAFILDM
jgi:parvulin-like peptidyl-prolyl isomerase